MKTVWNMVYRFDIKKSSKNTLFIGILILMNIMIGSLVWYTTGRILFSGISWLLCFAGYPAIIIGFFGGILYLYNHEF